MLGHQLDRTGDPYEAGQAGLVEVTINYLTLGHWKDSLNFGKPVGQRASLVERNNPDQSRPFKGNGIPDDHPVS